MSKSAEPAPFNMSEPHDASDEHTVSNALPFLVTLWLENYAKQGSSLDNTRRQSVDAMTQQALGRIHKSAAELASAFAALGAFGSPVARPLSSADETTAAVSNSRATFADMKRRWSHCPPDQLATIANAAAAASSALDVVADSSSPKDLVQASYESFIRKTRNPESGRTLLDAITLDEAIDTAPTARCSSILNQPAVILGTAGKAGKQAAKLGPGSTKDYALHLSSRFGEAQARAAADLRRHLDARESTTRLDRQIKAMRRSLHLQEAALVDFEQQRSKIVSNDDGKADTTLTLAALDDIKEGEKGCQRVISQLQRQLSGLEQSYMDQANEMKSAWIQLQTTYNYVISLMGRYIDPLHAVDSIKKPKKATLLHVVSRQQGIGRVPCSVRKGRHLIASQTAETRRSILSRFSHAATINTHISYPVYCLRFDRTGRFFITGADDYLVRVFKLAYYIPQNSKLCGSNLRGAVLVCTLKGHAGVINDIDVSSDNALIATASEDGDCRVWGLKDGCPIAILRGHVGGANMVSWSPTTPYRLVTTSADGLARVWDVRQACLTRYQNVVGQRPEYRLELAGSTGESLVASNSQDCHDPALDGSHRPGDPGPEVQVQNQDLAVPLPPLPPGPNEPVQLDAPQNQAINNDGRFVANSTIDEGVKLVSKLQHGAAVDERIAAPSTRSRRAAVKVICVARCPHGGHFATGSDDGICRVWRDDDDPSVQLADSKASPWRHSNFFSSKIPERRGRNAGALLLTLKGHLSPITDLHYSNEGDRLLTASQKEGVVRIWSWNVDPAASGSCTSKDHNQSPSHILLKLTNPNSTSSESQVNKRRPNRNSVAVISCDVASWLCDDTGILTSQCELAKQNGAEIIPGSQFIFLWDSSTGNCLLGISSAHSMQCPVVTPHPHDQKLLFTAGADGFAKLWDLNTGECIFSHKNIMSFGPIEARENGRLAGFLDGAFSPDGTVFVLTDDHGRVAIFDCVAIRKQVPEETHTESSPFWMREQYFANDYYDLLYDWNGYCIERGSEQPPHLAPRGVRCSCTGSPWSETEIDAFKAISGPLPFSSELARTRRQEIARKGELFRSRRYAQKRNMVGQFDPQFTALIRYGAITCTALVEVTQPEVATISVNPPAERARRDMDSFSSNFRWRDYSDMLLEEADAAEEEYVDPDDEEFELNEGRVALADGSVADDDELDDDEDEEATNSVNDSRQRKSSRSRKRSMLREVEESDDESVVQFTCTNNTPTGPYVADYELHFFKMQKDNVRRKWLRRVESDSSYSGRRSYVPQVGDSIVYIPRVHVEHIHEYPTSSFTGPWQSWPETAVWPVVRCSVRKIRYRFPNMELYRNRQMRSIVLILTLEVTGMPQLSEDFPWPNLTFVAPTTRHVFELSYFEYNTDYIMPLGLYISRMTDLEAALMNMKKKMGNPGPEIVVYYAEAIHQKSDDHELTPWVGRVTGIKNEDSPQIDAHLQNSGFRTVMVVWEDGDVDHLSPWEVNIRRETWRQPDRFRLSDDEKDTIRSALQALQANPDVAADFGLPVNDNVWIDYPLRIEVPMDLGLIASRVEADYYASRLSVASDIRLIRDNCAKYNSETNELTEVANQMVKTFDLSVLTDDERKEAEIFEQEMIARASVRPVLSDINTAVDDVFPEEKPRWSPRIAAESSRRQKSRSSAQAADPPQPGSRRIRVTVPVEHRPRRATQIPTQANVETSTERSRRTLEQLSNSNSRPIRGRQQEQGRSRGTRNAAGSRFDSAENPVRDSSRSRGVALNTRSTRGAGQSDLLVGRPTARVQASGERVQAPRFAGGNVSQRARQFHATPSTETASSRNMQSATRSTRAMEATDESNQHSSTRLTRSNRNGLDRMMEGSISLERRSGARPQRERVESSNATQLVSGGAQRRSTRSRRHSLEVDGVEGESERNAPEEQEGSAEDEDERQSSAEESYSSKEGTVYEDGGSEDVSLDEERSSASIELASSPRRRSARKDALSKSSSRPAKKDSAPPKSRKRQRKGKTDSSRRSPRKRAQKISSYEDPSSSEFGSDAFDGSDDNDSDDLDESISNKRRKVAEKSGQLTRSGQTQGQGQGSRLKQRSTIPNSDITYPDTKPWPEIDVKMITTVAKSLLERLRTYDENKLFALPVEEEYPDLAYRSKIENPMDFRTIEEERLPRYRSIRELQDDLGLVFGNCIRFNGPDHEFGSSAR